MFNNGSRIEAGQDDSVIPVSYPAGRQKLQKASVLLTPKLVTTPVVQRGTMWTPYAPQATSTQSSKDRSPPEASRADINLKLLGELSPQPAAWEYPLCDESRRCFVGYFHKDSRLILLRRFFSQVHNGVDWQQPIGPLGPQPRWTAWLADAACVCKYFYGGVAMKPSPFPVWMFELMEHYMPLCGLPSRSSWPNSCNLNLYQDGSHSVGWHADDEGLFQGKYQDCRIISLSLGQTRRFQFRLRCPSAGEAKLHEVVLHNGDLCTMEGLIQKHYHHRLPSESCDTAPGPRINLTWRWIVRHGPECRPTRRFQLQGGAAVRHSASTAAPRRFTNAATAAKRATSRTVGQRFYQ